MRTLTADVVVIGGGSTGVGVARDAAMRGYRVVLVERADLAQGTSGRFHGLLHSGGRYVVSDPESATECAAENAIVTRINADAVERTGGLFVSLPEDDDSYADQFWRGAQATGVPTQEISAKAALAREPRLNPGIKRVFEVQDASVDGWRLVWGAAQSAQAYGATVLTYHQVSGLRTAGGAISGVTCLNRATGEVLEIETGFVINAAGPWAGLIAELAGCHDVNVVPGRGVMVGLNHRLVGTVINRLAYPGDGDILVPAHTICVIGTTDRAVETAQLDHLAVPRAEIEAMLDCGEQLVPGFKTARVLHAWAGARPLIQDDRAADTRHMSRGMAVIDHQRDNLSGLITVVGGKLTTYRLMAQHAIDAMEQQLGTHHPCRTADEPVPSAVARPNHLVTARLQARETERAAGLQAAPQVAPDLGKQVICECELVTQDMLETQIKAFPTGQIDDWRRQLRLGMGPCQGGFCGLRAAGIACGSDGHRATLLLRLFVEHRWLGLWPRLAGAQARQAAFDAAIWAGTLNLAHLPATPTPAQFSSPVPASDQAPT